MKLLAALDRLPLTLISALMLGAAVAFFCLAMPVVLIEHAAGAIGLPSLLPAAGPPLGMKAQSLVAIAAGLIAAASAWLAVELADDTPPVEVEPDIEPDYGTTATRPATAPRPIFATSELGPPLDEYEAPAAIETVEAEIEPARPIPREEIVTAEWVEIVEEHDILELVDVIADDFAVASHRGESVEALATRFEAGLAKRAGLVTEPEPEPAKSASALRDAIEELRRMATR